MIADQYDKAGMTEKAEAFFEKGYGMAPDYKEGLVYYSQFLLKNKKTDRALELVEKLQGIDKFRFDYLLIKGIASTQTGRCEEAITFLLEANKIYNSDTNLLNALGYCFYKTGEKEQALQALGASLRLNPKQEDIRKLIDEIKK
jgi:tetratricopeptide (TPR) repeat protein